mmetsp:Transcript_30015/g.80322  ORF Transcript_30015/g.80322 Transcript_30015/m.80322 type:complete len:274 (+) Transcript_30015:965-1786(+)
MVTPMNKELRTIATYDVAANGMLLTILYALLCFRTCSPPGPMYLLTRLDIQVSPTTNGFHLMPKSRGSQPVHSLLPSLLSSSLVSLDFPSKAWLLPQPSPSCGVCAEEPQCTLAFPAPLSDSPVGEMDPGTQASAETRVSLAVSWPPALPCRRSSSAPLRLSSEGFCVILVILRFVFRSSLCRPSSSRLCAAWSCTRRSENVGFAAWARPCPAVGLPGADSSRQGAIGNFCFTWLGVCSAARSAGVGSASMAASACVRARASPRSAGLADPAT